MFPLQNIPPHQNKIINMACLVVFNVHISENVLLADKKSTFILMQLNGSILKLENTFFIHCTQWVFCHSLTRYGMTSSQYPGFFSCFSFFFSFTFFFLIIFSCHHLKKNHLKYICILQILLLQNISNIVSILLIISNM